MDGKLFDICVVYKRQNGKTTTFVYRGIKDYSFREGSPFLELTAVNGEITYIPYENIGYMSVLTHGVHGEGTPVKAVKTGKDANGRNIYMQMFNYLKEEGVEDGST